MFLVITFMLTGILIGYLLRKKPVLKISFLITPLIWFLLFLLGMEIGGNNSLIASLPTLGLEAVILASVAVLGSVLAAAGLNYYITHSTKKNQKES